jgi:hypothetical protein
MTWIITHKPAYDTDFIELAKTSKSRPPRPMLN